MNFLVKSYEQTEGRREKRVDTTMAGEPESGSDDFPWIISDKDHVTVLHNRFKVIMTEK